MTCESPHKRVGRQADGSKGQSLMGTPSATTASAFILPLGNTPPPPSPSTLIYGGTQALIYEAWSLGKSPKTDSGPHAGTHKGLLSG